MTAAGAVVMLVFLASYATMTMSAGMEGGRAKAIQWGCWALAVSVMIACYLAAPEPAG